MISMCSSRHDNDDTDCRRCSSRLERGSCPSHPSLGHCDRRLPVSKARARSLIQRTHLSYGAPHDAPELLTRMCTFDSRSLIWFARASQPAFV